MGLGCCFRMISGVGNKLSKLTFRNISSMACLRNAMVLKVLF